MESNENFTQPTDSVEASVEQPKKKAGRPKGSGGLANLRPFDHARSMAMQAKAQEARKARAEMRRKLLATVCEEGIDRHLAKALRNSDVDLMTVVEKAVNLVGLNYKDSEEAVQNLHVTAETNSKVKADYSLNLTFTDAK
jgi:hypothetical protein